MTTSVANKPFTQREDKNRRAKYVEKVCLICSPVAPRLRLMRLARYAWPNRRVQYMRRGDTSRTRGASGLQGKDKAEPKSRFPFRLTRSYIPPIAYLATLLALSITTALLFRHLPPPDLTPKDQGAVLLDRNGLPLRIVLDRSDQDQRHVHLSDISPWIHDAIVAVEDQRFHRHIGIDPLAILRATSQNLRFRRRISGASTLSTQVVRLSEPRRRTLITKVIEAIKALQLERKHPKTVILTTHLNKAPFGGNLVGVEAASRWYFDKSAADLTLAEAALLAGLPQSPSRLRPDRHLEAARNRMTHVLDRMRQENMITPQQHENALTTPLSIQTAARRPFLAPHFADFVVQHTSERGTIQTTLDAGLQRRIENMVQQHHGQIRNNNADNIAVIVQHVHDGAIRAMIGSPGYFSPDAGMVNAALARRSPGSALKPFLYALAIDQGAMTPATLLDDRPAGYRDIDPANFDGTFRGNVTVRDALILSLNIPAMKTLESLGIQSTIDFLQTLGLTSIDKSAAHYGTGLAIGGAEVRLLDIVNAYACIARNGLFLPPQFIAGRTPEPRRVLSAETAYIISDILGGTERSIDLFGHIADANLPRAAWKTGTSSAYRDAWTIAWTPDYVVGIWIGNSNGSATRSLTGATAAAPLAGNILRALYPSGGSPWFARPSQLREVPLPDGSYDHHIAGVTPIQQSTRAETNKPIRITAPADGSAYRIPHNIPGKSTLTLQAQSQGNLHWFANGRPIGTTHGNQPLLWPLQPGTWNLTAAAPHGNQASITITVDG